MMTRRTVLASAALSVATKPALLGGEAVRTTPWPSWPVVKQEEETAILSALRSGRWGRSGGKMVDMFEGQYAKRCGSRYCVATSSGTSALIATMGAMNFEPGDEVIVPPYTFVATVNAVKMFGAKPVFADSDLETFQVDPATIEPLITPRTRAILPVHIGGAPANLDAILAIAKKRNLPVIEDACQAHLGEWHGKQVGTFGLAGCFSFQASKNLNCGEGGAVLSNDEDFVERCFTFHNNGRGKKVPLSKFTYDHRGANLRLTEFQAAILIAQMTRIDEQAARRTENAAYLTKMLSEIAGVTPQKLYPGCTRNAWHLYMFRYQGRLPRDKFVAALRAEGVPCSTGYVPLNREPFLGGDQVENCPVNDKLCQQGVWFIQTMLLDTKQGMEQIAQAIRKIEGSADKISRA